MKIKKKIISDAWKITWSEKDDNWLNDGGVTYHESKQARDEYIESVLAKNTDSYSLVPLWIQRIT